MAGAALMVVAETDHLVLRRFIRDDADALIALHGDSEVMRYLTGRATPALEVRERTLPVYLAEYERLGDLGHWAAIERSTGAFVGWFGLTRDPDEATVLELGYRLCRAAWGQGLATEGARAVLELAFSKFGAERVTAQTMTVNHRSRAVMERLGMRFVRLFHGQWPETIEGSEHGDVEYAMDRPDWVSRRRRAPAPRSRSRPGPPAPVPGGHRDTG